MRLVSLVAFMVQRPAGCDGVTDRRPEDAVPAADLRCRDLSCVDQGHHGQLTDAEEFGELLRGDDLRFVSHVDLDGGVPGCGLADYGAQDRWAPKPPRRADPCPRDLSVAGTGRHGARMRADHLGDTGEIRDVRVHVCASACLLYTSDAADDLTRVDL